MECIFLNIINNFYIACLWKTFFTVYFFVVYVHAFRIDCNHETTKETALLMICKLSWGFVHVFSSNCLTTYICCCDQSAKQKKRKQVIFFLMLLPVSFYCERFIQNEASFIELSVYFLAMPEIPIHSMKRHFIQRKGCTTGTYRWKKSLHFYTECRSTADSVHFSCLP